MPAHPSMEEVVERLEKMRLSGKLTEAVKSKGINYSLDENGRIVAHHPDGRREVGTVRNGKFIPD